MIPASFHDFFLAEAGASAALIGLLFVAISVAPERVTGNKASIVEQARASSALTSFVLPLTISLVALLPQSQITVPAIVLSVAGLLFVAATLRRFVTARSKSENWRGLAGLAGFTAVLGVTLACGIFAAIDPGSAAPTNTISGVTIASVLLGIERAWALIGGRGTGRLASIQTIVRGDRTSEKD